MSNAAVYLVAVIIGVLYTVRKLDLRRRTPEEFPQVERAAFQRWQAREIAAYNLLTFACFAMVVVDSLWLWWVGRGGVGTAVIRVGGAVIFFAWAFALVIGFVRLRSARRLREQLGISLLRHATNAPPRG